MIDKEGTYSISEWEYNMDPCPLPSLRASLAKDLVMPGSNTPRHIAHRHPRLNPKYEDEPKRIFELGRCAHRLLLGEGAQIKIIEAKSYVSASAKAERERHNKAGYLAILQPDYETAVLMVGEARPQIRECVDAGAFDGADPFAKGVAECTMVWKEGDVWCRARPDWLSEDGEFLIDYKTCNASADPMLWQYRQMRPLAMHYSMAFYRRGLEKLGIANSPRVSFVVQETDAPYLLSIVHVEDELLAKADEEISRAIKIWAQCQKDGVYPGYSKTGTVVGMTERERTQEQKGEGFKDHLSSDDQAYAMNTVSNLFPAKM